MVCAVLNLDLVQCPNGAYNEIKDRKGYLTKKVCSSKKCDDHPRVRHRSPFPVANDEPDNP